LNPHNLRIVLLLQGGGALGAYQAGVYQALHEHMLVPNWIVGTSIGAINGALIAGNPPTRRLAHLKAFWDRVSHPDFFDMKQISDDQRRLQIFANTADTILRGAPGMFAPRIGGFALGLTVPPEQAGFYDTTPLAETLEELIDFGYLNGDGEIRFTANAIGVTTGALAHFDSLDGMICADHVRASGALPPAFAPVRIDGQLYWDGGLYSNTPLESVLGELPTGDTLCFMVDLWSGQGLEPENLEQVRTRQKDVMFASRSQREIDEYLTSARLQNKARELYARLAAEQRTPDDERALAELGCATTLHIVRLQYAGQDWSMAAKDVNFSQGSVEWRWEQGYQDAQRAIEHAGWLVAVQEDMPVVLHELPAHDVAERQAD
jgi:NTE family protein